MRKRRAGLSDEVDLPEVSSTFLPLKEGAVNEKEIARAWDESAEFWSRRYTEFGDINRQFVIDPAIFRMLGSVHGLRILDAGCGNGYLCRLLAKKGAKVSGVDISKRFIEIAKKKEKEAPLGIDYYVSSVCDLKMFADGIFDIVVSNLVLMDVTDLNKTFSEFRRVLKPNGKLVFSIMHPCFASPPVHGWVREPRDSDRKEDWLFWKVDRYFDRTIEVWRYFDSPPLYSYHRPLSDYVKALLNNGFVITDFEEPIPSREAMRKHYREFANEYDRIPWFLVIGAKAS
jgi:2-polyprenyl-3-methyl-5-hydroxy-6-metoxy-1,4-benzoquinol methylase